MIALLQQQLKGLADSLNDDDFGNAVDDAERETWSLPQTSDFKIKWIKERAKRHLFSYLQAESAPETQFGNIHLEHRFKHYAALIKQMDDDFRVAIEENALEFADVADYQLAGHKIDAGFAYDNQTGVDLTYDEAQEVIITPNENS